MTIYARAITSPWVHLLCGIIMIILAGETVWESLHAGGTRHGMTIGLGVLVLGMLVLVEALGLFLEGLETTAEGVEELPWSVPHWIARFCWKISHNTFLLGATAALLLLMGAVDAIHVALEDHYASLPTAVGLIVLAVSMSGKAIVSFYESAFFAEAYGLKVPKGVWMVRLMNPWVQVATGVIVLGASLWEEGLMAAAHMEGAWREADWGLAVYGLFTFLRFFPKAWSGVALFMHPAGASSQKDETRLKE